MQRLAVLGAHGAQEFELFGGRNLGDAGKAPTKTALQAVRKTIPCASESLLPNYEAVHAGG